MVTGLWIWPSLVLLIDGPVETGHQYTIYWLQLLLTLIWTAPDWMQQLEGQQWLYITIFSTITHSSGVNLRTAGRENQKKSSMASCREDQKYIV